jgi:hypothetical protein
MFKQFLDLVLLPFRSQLIAWREYNDQNATAKIVGRCLQCARPAVEDDYLCEVHHIDEMRVW